MIFLMPVTLKVIMLVIDGLLDFKRYLSNTFSGWDNFDDKQGWTHLQQQSEQDKEVEHFQQSRKEHSKKEPGNFPTFKLQDTSV